MANGEKKVEQKKVIIIGGGAAGIATAERLERGGEGDFLILEATGRVGGRVRSQRVGKVEKRVEFGATFIHGEVGNVVYQLAEKWGMLNTEDQEGGILEEDFVYVSEKGERMDPELINIFEEVTYEIQNNLESLNPDELRNYSSKGDFFTASLNQELQNDAELQEVESEALQYLQWYGRLQALAEGAPSWFDVAVDGDQVYEESPGNQDIILSKDTNYITLIERLGSGVMDRVILNERVLKVRQLTNDTVEVETDTTLYQCEYVVVTVSLGVLKGQLVEFIPSLPTAKTQAIESIGFGLETKVFLEYEADIATLDTTGDGFFFLRTQEGETQEKPWENLPTSPWQDGIFSLLPVQYHLNQRIMSVWLSGPAALQVESLPNSSLLESISSFLSSYLTPSNPLAHPISATVTTWGTENTTLGSWSYLNPTTPRNAQASLASPVGRVLWAGEATHSTHFSTVHGAIESGWREAERILGWKN